MELCLLLFKQQRAAVASICSSRQVGVRFVLTWVQGFIYSGSQERLR